MQSKATRVLARLQHGLQGTARVATGPVGLDTRGKTTVAKAKSSSMFAMTNDVAQKLHKTGSWNRAPSRKKSNGEVRAIEPRRVNIVSEDLCDDILTYMGPSLDRHRGCDLIDLNPGAGVWSRKLHDRIEPRKHVMMDVDAELYSPFLGELLAKKNVELVPQSGLVWKNLLDMIDAHLVDQHKVSVPADATPVRNDTLLVTANLSTYPKKTFLGFESMSVMLLYQFMASIRTSTLFQRYGLVRMLIWTNDEDKRRLLPRSLNRRKKSAFEAELSCEWIHEVAGLDAEVQDRCSLRDEWVNVESACQTLQRMKAAGLEMPRGRESQTYRRTLSEPELMGQKLAGVRPPTLDRPFRHEIEELQQEQEQEQEQEPAAPSEAMKRLVILRRREKLVEKDSLLYLDLLQERDEIIRLALAPRSAVQFRKADAAWNARIENLKKNTRNEFNGIRDGYHLFRQSTTGLLWDRRAYEPLSVRPDDFYPNAPSTLLDIQPKAMHPLFRQHGPDTSRSGDMSEVMLRFWFHHTLLSVPKAMEGLWSGFGDLIGSCPSVRDVSRGGVPMTGPGALTVRAMNEAQWVDILQAWMDWPFRPRYTQMLGRLVEDAESDLVEDEDTKSGATGLA
ncbi:hypothetical protein E4U42_002920 [Claviceps africana]|uniref:rRNA adenine N(6)-methyltransferase n=1 Tax=Claviceps africana TaxID=83212 RepID=A0A8K0JDM2_9HYPO|nr:hypothetical protein E4U42_002920 [Claviceps africana]